MAGRAVKQTWNGRPVDAWLPDKIGRLNVELPTATVRRTERAAAAAVRMGDRAAGPMEVAARLLLRAEGLASSAIEGVHAPIAEVAVAEALPDGVAGDAATAAWVADNLAVVADALAGRGRLKVETLRRWHRRLMRHAPEATLVGRWRDRLGWVGGANPLLAAHVGAPPGRIAGLMDDLAAYVARDDVDAVTQAAIAHAQFEIVHPFADGNGRIGRILVGRILSHRLGVAVPPPVSTQFARDVGGYLSGLILFRQGQVDAWVSWFAEAVETAATRSSDVLEAAVELHSSWRVAVADLRTDAAVRRLVEQLPAHPALTAAKAAELCGVSEQAARGALAQLVERGVLREADASDRRTPGRPPRWWIAHDLLALLGR
jgi:Fic family protein